MTIDNFNKIHNILDFSNPEDFYFVQVLKRRKDNHDSEKDVKVVRSYDINSSEDFEKLIPSIKEKCLNNNARAYINLNKKNYRKVAHKMIDIVNKNIYDERYKECSNAFYKAIGNTKRKGNSEENKLMIVDIDVIDFKLILGVVRAIQSLHSRINQNKKDGEDFSIKEIIRTVNGCHIVTNPFDVKEFNKIKESLRKKNGEPFQKEDMSVQTEGNTLLFYKQTV